jgi:hypothetical protein
MSISAGTKLPPPFFMTNITEWQRKAVTWMLQTNQGHIDNCGSVSLLSGTATTILTDSRIGLNSFIGFMPKTANAAAEIGGGTLYVGSQSEGAATLTHANDVTGDRTFRFCILG